MMKATHDSRLCISLDNFCKNLVFIGSPNTKNLFCSIIAKLPKKFLKTCAPNYRYVTRMLRHDEFRYEPTGTCFTLKDKMRKLEEHSPCRNGNNYFRIYFSFF